MSFGQHWVVGRISHHRREFLHAFSFDVVTINLEDERVISGYLIDGTLGSPI
jgi:hypothetical protein